MFIDYDFPPENTPPAIIKYADDKGLSLDRTPYMLPSDDRYYKQGYRFVYHCSDDKKRYLLLYKKGRKVKKCKIKPVCFIYQGCL